MRLLFTLILLVNFSNLIADSKSDKKSYDAIESHNKVMKKLETDVKATAKKARSCDVLIKRHCKESETKTCAQSIVHKLPDHCKMMITDFDETSEDSSGGLGHCTSVAIKKCTLPDDVDENSGGLVTYQKCLEAAMKADKSCIDTLKEKVKSNDGESDNNTDVYKEFVR